MNTLGDLLKTIATFFGLENPEQVTGHSLRRSSASALEEAGADALTLKRHGRWRSDAVAERYVTESVQHQVSVAKRICYGNPSTSNKALAPAVPVATTSKADAVSIPASSNGLIIMPGTIFNGPVTINYVTK